MFVLRCHFQPKSHVRYEINQAEAELVFWQTDLDEFVTLGWMKLGAVAHLEHHLGCTSKATFGCFWHKEDKASN